MNYQNSLADIIGEQVRKKNLRAADLDLLLQNRL